MNIRAAAGSDRNQIHGIHMSAFAEDERDIVAKLAVDLLSEDTTPETISLVAEIEGVIVGHAAFSPVTMDNGECPGHILGPLGVRPDNQKQGIGTQLVKSGIQQLSDMGTGIVFVYGDPGYYNRFGFTEEAAASFIPPYKLQYPFGWLGMALGKNNNETGRVQINCVASLCDPSLW